MTTRFLKLLIFFQNVCGARFMFFLSHYAGTCLQLDFGIIIDR